MQIRRAQFKDIPANYEAAEPSFGNSRFDSSRHFYSRHNQVHGGRALDYVKAEAKRLGCYEVTLNVWEGNDSAINFYKKNGLKVKETNMEFIL